MILRQENQEVDTQTFPCGSVALIDLASSCSGQVLLANLDSEELELLLETLPLGRVRHDRRQSWVRRSKRCRKRGYEIIPSPITAGVTDIGFPIRGFDGK